MPIPHRTTRVKLKTFIVEDNATIRENLIATLEELANIESEIQLARRYYNGAARAQNDRVQTFPANLVSASLGFATLPYFEIDDPADRAVPRISFDDGAGA